MSVRQGNKIIAGGGGLDNIGNIYYTTRSTVPNGGVWCTGGIITQEQNPQFYQMLVTGKILSITYDDYDNQLLAKGYCESCALDTTAKSFRVPTKPNIVINRDGTIKVKGNGNTLGLTDGAELLCGMAEGGSGNAFSCSKTGYGQKLPFKGSVDNLTDGTTVGITTDADKSGLVADVEVSEYKAYIVVFNKSTDVINLEHEIQLNNPFFFGMYHFFENKPNNASWLISNGSFHKGDIYQSYYQWLVSAQVNAIEGISVKLNTEEYTDFDYVINNTDGTFRLPVKVKGASGSAIKGNGKTIGITDGTQTAGLILQGGGDKTIMLGGFEDYNTSLGKPTAAAVPTLMKNQRVGITSEADKSGIITAEDGLKLYFYVGETTQDANLILAGRTLEQLTSKLDADLGNLSTAGRENLKTQSGVTVPTQEFIDLGGANPWIAVDNGIIIYQASGLGDWGEAVIIIGNRDYRFRTFGNTNKGGWVQVAKGEEVRFGGGGAAYKRFFYSSKGE